MALHFLSFCIFIDFGLRPLEREKLRTTIEISRMLWDMAFQMEYKFGPIPKKKHRKFLIVFESYTEKIPRNILKI